MSTPAKGPAAPGDRRQSRKSSHAGIGGVPVDRRYTAIKERPRSWGGRPLFADDDIELFIVVTAYKEDAAQIDCSLQGVQQGIKDLMAIDPEGRTDTKLLGPDAWKHIAVCVVCDGRVRNGSGKVFIDDGPGERAYRSAASHAASNAGGAAADAQTWTRPQFFKDKYGLWDGRDGRDAARPFDDGSGVPTEMHLFEATCDAAWMAGKRHLGYFRDGLLETPMKMMLAVKEENKASKLDSHLWFLRAFAAKVPRLLATYYCLLGLLASYSPLLPFIVVLSLSHFFFFFFSLLPCSSTRHTSSSSTQAPSRAPRPSAASSALCCRTKTWRAPAARS